MTFLSFANSGPIWRAAVCTWSAILLLVLSAGELHAQGRTISLAVNAGSGDSNNIYNTQDIYHPFASMLSKALNVRVEAKPLLASLVKSSIYGNRYPLLLVHTNDAAEAIKSKRYKVIGFSQDLGNNRILFFARKGSTATKLADIAGRCVVATDSFAAATAVAIMKKKNLFDNLRSYTFVREGDALEFHLKTNFCEIAILRSDAGAQKLVAAGHRQIHASAEFPVFVLLADKKLGQGAIEKLRKLMVEFQPDANSAFMKETGIVTFDTDQADALELFNLY
ncbi:MAG: PhnD/SsuA/transferrin family substrate-binding protein [Pseudomonadota bacterium]